MIRKNLPSKEAGRDLNAGVRVAAVATVLTLALAGVKGAVGYLHGSPALLADAVHSAADTVAIFASWIGLKLATRPPSSRFPFGFYRAETLASLIVSGIIIVAGVQLLVDTIQGMMNGAAPQYRSLAVLGVALGSAAVSCGIFLWEARVGRRIHSQSLLANADESRSDILSSMAVFAGATATYFAVPYLERVVALGLAALILWLGLKHGRAALYALLDASLDPDLEREAAAIATATPGVMRVEQVRLRRSGPVRFGVAHIHLRKSIDVSRGHEVAHEVVRRVKEAIPEIEMLTVHLEPFRPVTQVVAVPAEGNAAEAGISDHFGRARFFAVAGVSGGNTTIDDFAENTVRDKAARAGLAAVKEILQEHGVDVVITREIGEIAFHTLRDSYIEVYSAPSGTVRDALDRFARGELTVLAKPTHASEGSGRPADPEGKTGRNPRGK